MRKPDKTVKEHLRCEFTKEELLKHSESLANNLSEKRYIESNAKSAAQQFKKQLADIEGEISQLGDWVSQGFEIRQVGCLVYFHSPKAGRKQTVREDTGEIIGDSLMTSEELQMALKFEEENAEGGFKLEPDQEEDEETQNLTNVGLIEIGKDSEIDPSGYEDDDDPDHDNADWTPEA